MSPNSQSADLREVTSAVEVIADGISSNADVTSRESANWLLGDIGPNV